MTHFLFLWLVITLCPLYATDLNENSKQNSGMNNHCPFNVVVNKIRHLALQSCPFTGILSNDSQHTLHSIRCSDNSEIKHYVMNKCDVITQTPYDHQYFVTSVRRRQLVSSLFHSNLAEACISYKIFPQQTQTDSVSIFLPLCLDSIPSPLTPTDIDSLIANKTFRTKTNVKSAAGAHVNGEIGILVELAPQMETNHFRVCLKNIVVETDDLRDSIDIHSIGKSHGIMIDHSKQIRTTCAIDGIPCFNFFFQQQSKCVPDTTDDNFNDLQSVMMTTEDKSVEFSIHFSDENIYNVIISFGPSLLYNMWGVAIAFLMFNIVIYFCLWLKSSSSSSVDSDDGEDISEIIMIV